MPEVGSSDEYWLYLFATFQALRTEKTFMHFEQAHSGIRSRIIEGGRRHGENLTIDDVNRVMGEPPNMAVSLLLVAWDLVEYLSDLKAHLMIARTSKFITSDNPAFRYNQFCQDFRMDGAIGAKKKGFQLFAPIAPEICMVFYDGSTYKVARGDYRLRTTCIDDTDVHALNRLQIVSAQDALYFSNWEHRRIIHKELLKACSLRDEYRSDVQEFIGEEDPRESIFMTQELIPNICLQLRCLRMRRRAMRIPGESRHRRYRAGHAVGPGRDWEPASLGSKLVKYRRSP